MFVPFSLLASSYVAELGAFGVGVASAEPEAGNGHHPGRARLSVAQTGRLRKAARRVGGGCSLGGLLLGCERPAGLARHRRNMYPPHLQGVLGQAMRQVGELACRPSQVPAVHQGSVSRMCTSISPRVCLWGLVGPLQRALGRRCISELFDGAAKRSRGVVTEVVGLQPDRHASGGRVWRWLAPEHAGEEQGAGHHAVDEDPHVPVRTGRGRGQVVGRRGGVPGARLGCRLSKSSMALIRPAPPVAVVCPALDSSTWVPMMPWSTSKVA